MPAFFVRNGRIPAGGPPAPRKSLMTNKATVAEQRHITNMERRNTFSKKERLTSVKSITRLFEAGNSLVVYPLKVVWLPFPDDSPFAAQAAFAVSRRNFRKAVDRNLLKRRMREAYRLGKNSFYDACGERKIILMFIYIAKEPLPSKNIAKAMATTLNRIAGKLV